MFQTQSTAYIPVGVPELPEVETTRRGIEPHLLGRTVYKVVVREPRLRWPVPSRLAQRLRGQEVLGVGRRGKYLLLELTRGTLIIHLGMSGSLFIIPEESPAGQHEHLDIIFSDSNCLRLRDPRRFGAVLWTKEDPLIHPLLITLGPEPLDEAFNGELLHDRSRGRRTAVKSFLMDSKVVVGVGNIYASEALFAAGIHPTRPAGKIGLKRYERLAGYVKEVLSSAIEQGGTTLRDFVGGDGNPGYFALKLKVYGRAGEACGYCGSIIRQKVIGQRSSFYCGRCQT